MIRPENRAEYLERFPHAVSVVNVTLANDFLHDDASFYDFELNFPRLSVRQWFQQNRHLSIYVAVIYILITFISQSIMKYRPRCELRRPLIIWNVFMALFSAVMAYRIMGLFIDKCRTQTLYGLVCDGRRAQTPAMTWVQIFTITKVIEFGDTAFIIMRKQHLAFIHWFHHATVVIVCWYALGAALGPANGVAFSGMNSVVHTFMYIYYALRAARVAIPKNVSMSLTCMQIAQMFIGIGLNLISAYYFFFRSTEMPCDEDSQQIAVALSVYFIYVLLFCNFFYKTYFSKAISKQRSSKKID